MKTRLPERIATVTEAEAFLNELFYNGEQFHPEESAFDIIRMNTDGSGYECKFSEAEAEHLDRLMDEIYNLPGNDRHPMAFDPCEYLLGLQLRNE